MPSETPDEDVIPEKKLKLCFPLHSAIEAGDTEFVEKLFRYNGVPDINAFNEKGLTPLHVAVLYEQQKIGELLLMKGANVNSKTNEQRAVNLPLKWNNQPFHFRFTREKCYSKLTALHIAIMNGSKGIIHMLVENGADVDLENEHNLRPVHCAIVSGCIETTSLLFKNGAKINKKSEKELDDDEDITDFVDCLENHKWLDSALHSIIIELQNVEMLDLLIKNGADVNSHSGGYSVLHAAVICNSIDMVKILVKNGANLDFPCQNEAEHYGQTALHFAMEPKDFEIARFLIKWGADVNHQSELTTDEESYSTPLHMAVYEGSYDTAELLMKSGANSYIRNCENKTPLDMAVTNDDAMIRILLLNGADPEDCCTCGSCDPCCPPKSYELALDIKDMNSLKILLNITHSF